MKNFYTRIEIAEGYPTYDFVIRARNLESAVKKANKIYKEDYPEEYRKDDVYCSEITPEQLLARMTIN